MVIKSQKGRGKKIHILLDSEYQITTDVDFGPNTEFLTALISTRTNGAA